MKPFRVEFTDTKLTVNAVLVQLGRFANELELQNILERRLSLGWALGKSPNRYRLIVGRHARLTGKLNTRGLPKCGNSGVF
ncbi:MAG: hypothetical protein PHW74_09990 [Desulfobacca sp.]|nr:hypothetical protein [Desulfobacca sp.]